MTDGALEQAPGGVAEEADGEQHQQSLAERLVSDRAQRAVLVGLRVVPEGDLHGEETDDEPDDTAGEQAESREPRDGRAVLCLAGGLLDVGHGRSLPTRPQVQTPSSQSVIRCQAMDTGVGRSVPFPSRSSSFVNHRASSSSPSRATGAASASHTARKPSIRLAGNGHGWLLRYRTSRTTRPVSSTNPRKTACSALSPGSTKPARVE